MKMTSTSFNVGLTDNTRLSSRVLRPPGGGHTDIFGGEPDPPRTGRRGGPPPQGQGDEPPKPMNGTEAPSQNGQEAPPAPEPRTEPAAVKPEPVCSTSPVEQAPKPAPNVEAREAPKPEPVKAELPKRVRVPPGGFSSGLW